MSEPTRQEVLRAMRERVAHLEIHRGRGRIGARIHELACMRVALRELEAAKGEPEEEDGYPGSLLPPGWPKRRCGVTKWNRLHILERGTP
jgi:hypothetical protein